LAVTTGCAVTPHREPEKSENRRLIGLDYFNKGLHEQALAELMESVRLDPENAEAHNLIGLVFLRQGVDALDLADRIQCLQGVAAAEQHEIADDKVRRAAGHFEKAAKYKQNFSEALNNLAVTALHFKDYPAVIRYEGEALSNILYRDSHVALGNRGWAYFQEGDAVRAARDLRQAVFHQPGFCLGRYRLAEVYYSRKEYTAAADELEKVWQDPACPIQEAYHLYGKILALQGDRDGARERFARCQQVAKQSCLARQCERDAQLVN
jgi:type IV pilus assembly protein PilF